MAPHQKSRSKSAPTAAAPKKSRRREDVEDGTTTRSNSPPHLRRRGDDTAGAAGGPPSPSVGRGGPTAAVVADPSGLGVAGGEEAPSVVTNVTAPGAPSLPTPRRVLDQGVVIHEGSGNRTSVGWGDDDFMVPLAAAGGTARSDWGNSRDLTTSHLASFSLADDWTIRYPNRTILLQKGRDPLFARMLRTPTDQDSHRQTKFERDLARGRNATLESELANARVTIANLQDEKAALQMSADATIANLHAELDVVRKENQEFRRQREQARKALASPSNNQKKH